MSAAMFRVLFLESEVFLRAKAAEVENEHMTTQKTKVFNWGDVDEALAALYLSYHKYTTGLIFVLLQGLDDCGPPPIIPR